MSLFSPSGLNRLLHSYELTSAQRLSLQLIKENAIEQLTRGRHTEGTQTFYLCIGGAGSGSTDYIQIFAGHPDTNIVPVLTEPLRKELLPYKAAYKEAIQDGENPTASHEKAVKHSENARIWLARSIASELYNDGIYSIAYPCNPRNLAKGNLLQELQHAEDVQVKVFTGTLESIVESATKSNGLHAYEDYEVMPQTIERALRMQARPVEIFWRDKADEEPKSIAIATPEKGLVVTDTEAFKALRAEVKKITNNDHFTLAHLRDIYDEQRKMQREQQTDTQPLHTLTL